MIKITEKKKDDSKTQNSDFPMVNSKYQEDKKIFISYANEDFMRIEPIYEKPIQEDLVEPNEEDKKEKMQQSLFDF